MFSYFYLLRKVSAIAHCFMQENNHDNYCKRLYSISYKHIFT